MKKRCLTSVIASALLLVAMVSATYGALSTPPKPNIIFILADDLGYADLNCYGSTFYETPNLDRLAAQGMRFTSAYAACPVCSPTRGSLLTGKYPPRFEVTDFIGGNRTGKLIPASYKNHLELEEVTVAEALKSAGYVTGFIGKWHLGGKGFWPEQQGFDVNLGGCEKGHPSSYFSPYRMPNLTDGPPGEYLTDRLTDEAMKFFEANKDRPFLLWFPHYAVHTPLQAKPALVRKYQAKAAELHSGEPRFRPEGVAKDRRIQDHAIYAAMVESLDQSTGRILDKLTELNVERNTIVIFTSDNGGLSTSEGAPTSNAPLRAGKGWLYEGGIREPLLIKWPGVTAQGSLCDTPVISPDFYPTILEMAGLPLRPQQHRDGLSLLPLLNQSGSLPIRSQFWHYPHYGNQGGVPGGAIRVGDWKLIEFFEDMHVELYNLKSDIGEQTNLAASSPEKVKELRSQLHAVRQETGALMPKPNPEFSEDATPKKSGKK